MPWRAAIPALSLAIAIRLKKENYARADITIFSDFVWPRCHVGQSVAAKVMAEHL
jgi:hypothetical protein